MSMLYYVSALVVAGRIGDLCCLDILLQAGADVNAKNSKGYTAIHYASERNYEDCLNVLLASGADVNVVNNTGSTPLHLAAYYRGDVTLTRVLLRAGADVNAQDEKTFTALHYAIIRNHSECESVLRSAGARVNYVSEAPEETDLSLMHLCREAVRSRLMLVNEQTNLFLTVPRLPLPTVMIDFLLYNININDTK